MNEVLLSIVSALVLSLIFFSKWLVDRSDKNAERAADQAERDREASALQVGGLLEAVRSALSQLKEAQIVTGEAVSAFKVFEHEEAVIHTKILEKLDNHASLLREIAENQRVTAEILSRLTADLRKPC